jgi:hypothetical protein
MGDSTSLVCRADIMGSLGQQNASACGNVLLYLVAVFESDILLFNHDYISCRLPAI